MIFISLISASFFAGEYEGRVVLIRSMDKECVTKPFVIFVRATISEYKD